MIVAVSDSIHSSFPVEYFYIYIYIFFSRKLSENSKTNTHKFHVFVAYINACLRDQFNMRHRANK